MKNLFSERHRYQQIKELRPDKISENLKRRIWNIVQKCIESPGTFGIFYRYNDECRRVDRHDFIEILWDEFFKEDLSMLRNNYRSGFFIEGRDVYRSDSIRDKFYMLKWYKIYDLIEFIMNRFRPDEKFISPLNEIFEDERTLYRIIDNLVTPITSKKEVEEIEKALNIDDPYQTVKIHLEKSLEYYSKRPKADPKNSIKESISALEALSRIILNNPKGTLGKLTEKLSIHPAFREAINKLYGWTSDEGGIRHSETGEKISSGEEEALFMLVLSSAFVNYIISKQKNVKI